MNAEKLEKLKVNIASKAPVWVFHVSVFFYSIYKNITMPEIKRKFGEENPDKTFFVIRLFPPATGFLANYNYVLGYMRYALNKGYIPVVDMQNYETLYTEKKAVHGTRNVWEYYFEQPLDVKSGKRYSLEEVYRSKNVILSNGSMQLYDFTGDKQTIEWQCEMSKLVPFNNITKEYIQNKINEQIPQDINLIGVPTRGSEQKKRVIGHPIPVTAKELVPILHQRLEQWKHGGKKSALFIKAEEQETIDFLKQEFQGKIYYTKATRIKDYNANTDMPASNANTSISRYQSTLEYLTDIYILSTCDSIIGSMNNGLYTALIWNGNKYSNVEIIDKGRYK